MNHKIKILFAILVLGTVLSVFSWVDYFNQSIASVGNNIKNLFGSISNMSFSVDTDPDKDGLSNLDETYWNTDFKNPDTDGDGFLDGEEVASGHDPTVPGPNDLLKDTNLTQKLSDLATAGLVEGSLKPGSPNYEKSLNDLTLAVLDDSVLSLAPKIDLSKLVTIASSKENQQLYAQKVKTIFQQITVTIDNQLSLLATNKDTLFLANDTNAQPDDSFLKISEEFKNIYDQTLSVPVPDTWKTNHIFLLNTLSQFSETNKALAYRARDPIKGIAAFKLWATTYDGFFDLIKSYADQMIKEGLISDSNK